MVRHRSGHYCETAWLMICLVAWEGVPAEQADELYSYLCNTLPTNGFETERRCGTNERYLQVIPKIIGKETKNEEIVS